LQRIWGSFGSLDHVGGEDVGKIRCDGNTRRRDGVEAGAGVVEVDVAGCVEASEVAAP
jgi:hypothetical protein